MKAIPQLRGVMSARWGKSIVIGIAVITATAFIAITAASADPEDGANAERLLQHQADLAELLKKDGSPYPPVVARVNGIEIPNIALTQRLYMIEVNPSVGADEASRSEEAVLDQLIREQVLIQYSIDLGVRVSTEDAQAYAKAQSQVISESWGQQGQDLLAVYATQIGVPGDELMDHPATIEAFRKSMVLGQMYAKFRAQIPSEQFSSQDAFAVEFDRRVDDFVEQRIETLEIYIN